MKFKVKGKDLPTFIRPQGKSGRKFHKSSYKHYSFYLACIHPFACNGEPKDEVILNIFHLQRMQPFLSVRFSIKIIILMDIEVLINGLPTVC